MSGSNVNALLRVKCWLWSHLNYCYLFILLQLLSSPVPLHSRRVICTSVLLWRQSPWEDALQSCEQHDKHVSFSSPTCLSPSPTVKPTLSKTALFCSRALGVEALKTNILDNSSCLPVISPGPFRHYNKIQDDSAGVLNGCIRISHVLAVCYLVRLLFRQFRLLCKHCKNKCLIFKTFSRKKLLSSLLVIDKIFILSPTPPQSYICKRTICLTQFIKFFLDTEFFCHVWEQFSVVRDQVIIIFEVMLRLWRSKDYQLVTLFGNIICRW